MFWAIISGKLKQYWWRDHSVNSFHTIFLSWTLSSCCYISTSWTFLRFSQCSRVKVIRISASDHLEFNDFWAAKVTKDKQLECAKKKKTKQTEIPTGVTPLLRILTYSSLFISFFRFAPFLVSQFSVLPWPQWSNTHCCCIAALNFALMFFSHSLCFSALFASLIRNMWTGISTSVQIWLFNATLSTSDSSGQIWFDHPALLRGPK